MKFIFKRSTLLIVSLVLLTSSCSNPASATPTVSAPTPTTPPSTLAVVPIPTQTAEAIQLPPDLEYGILLERVKQSDPNFDFTKLRWTFAQTASYDPYNFDDGELEDSMYDAYNNNDFELAIEFANQILEKNYLLPDPHLILLQSYQALEDDQNADFHNYFLRGLITSIVSSGDGKSPETAFIVIQIEEEHFMLSILGLVDSDQTFTEIDGIPYDIFNGIDEATNEPASIYFDISIPYGWLNDSLPQ